MAIPEQTDLMVRLGDMGEKLPGLDVDKILENIANKVQSIKDAIAEIKEELKEIRERKPKTTKEEIEKAKEEEKAALKEKIKALIDDYKAKIKQMVMDAIAEIKAAWKEIKASLKQIPKDVAAAIANIALPPAIGVPPVAPNPIYALNIVLTTKGVLSAILNAIASSMIKLIKAANMIMFELPQPVLVVGDTVKTLATLINTIPG